MSGEPGTRNGPRETDARPSTPWSRPARVFWPAAGLGLVLAAGTLGWSLRSPSLEAARIRRLDLPLGTVASARFAPDGRRIYFSIRAGGRAPESYVSDPDSPEPRPLGIKDAVLLAVSPRGELAFAQASARRSEVSYSGRLVVTDALGAVLGRPGTHAMSAAWDGPDMVVLSEEGTRQSMAFPPGRPPSTWDEASRNLERLALSGDGSLLACMVSDDVHNVSRIEVLDRRGNRRVLYTPDEGVTRMVSGLAWGPGNEVWVSELDGDQSTLLAVALDGARRVLWRGQGNLVLMDVSKEGKALLVQQTPRRSVWGLRAGAPQPRRLSIQGLTQLRGISADGGEVLLDESPMADGGSPGDRWYLRGVDGGPIRSPGRGFGLTISLDGDWVQVLPGPVPIRELPLPWTQALGVADPSLGEAERAGLLAHALLFVPGKGGRPVIWRVPEPFQAGRAMAYVLPDGKSLLANLTLGGWPVWARVDRSGGPPSVLTPPGRQWPGVASLQVLSPDGARMILAEVDKAGHLSWFTLSLSGGAPEPIRGMRGGERAVGWSADGAAVYLRNPLDQLPVTITRLDLETGARRAAFAFRPLDPAAFVESRDAFVTPDGKACAVEYEENTSDVYVVEGLGAGI